MHEDNLKTKKHRKPKSSLLVRFHSSVLLSVYLFLTIGTQRMANFFQKFTIRLFRFTMKTAKTLKFQTNHTGIDYVAMINEIFSTIGTEWANHKTWMDVILAGKNPEEKAMILDLCRFLNTEVLPCILHHYCGFHEEFSRKVGVVNGLPCEQCPILPIVNKIEKTQKRQGNYRNYYAMPPSIQKECNAKN